MKKAAMHIRVIFLLLLGMAGGGKLLGQGCSGTVPHFTIDMTGTADSSWTSASIQRQGRCCGLNFTNRCIHFTVTLDPGSMGIRMDVTLGTTTGYTFQSSCGNTTNVGDTMCLTGGGTYEITLCRSGVSTSQIYTITSIPRIDLVEDSIVASSVTCTPKLVAQFLQESTITWHSATNNSTYNSYLNCLSGCDTTIVTIPSTETATYIDYVVSGYSALNSCDTSRAYDTVRVYNGYANVNAGNDTAICSAANSVNLNGVVNAGTSQGWTGRGGRFIPDSTTLNAIYVPSLTEVAAGSTYLVLTSLISTGCYIRDTLWVDIYSAPISTINGPATVCEFSANQVYSVTAQTGHTYDWHVVGGIINSGQGTNQVQVTWDTAAPGYMYMVQTDTNGCQGVAAIQTISRFDFNAGPITTATIGPDAISSDPDAYSNGFGYQITDNCTGGKGIDLVVPGSVFDRGKLCMTYSWQRDENQADFFIRGGTSFRIDGGQLIVTLRISDGAGGYTDIGPTNTGYTVPHDDIFRYLTFCYDSASGNARVMMNDSLVWNYNGTPGRGLYWTGAGDAIIGTMMDGSCAGRTLVDWSNVSVPISIIAKPNSTISGPNSSCQFEVRTYTTISGTGYTYNWVPNGGTVLSGQGNDTVNIQWISTGSRTLQLTITDANGCDSTISTVVGVSSTPGANINGNDTVCLGTQNRFTAPTVANTTYAWSSTGATFSGGTTNDTAFITYNSIGLKTLTLTMTSTASGCDSTITMNIYVDSFPVAAVTGSTSVCMGSTASVYQTTQRSGYTYTWSATGGGIVSSGQGTYSAGINWSTTGSKTVQVIVARPSGCSTTATRTVTVSARPAASITGSDTICIGTSQKYNAPVAAGTTYSWSSTGATFTGGTTRDSAVVSYATAGTKTLSLTITNTTSGCDSTITMSIYVDSFPNVAVSGASPICLVGGAASSVYQTSQQSGYTYTWSATGGTVTSGQGTYAATIRWTTSGSKTVQVIVARPSGCSTTANMSVTVNTPPAASITGPDTICIGTGQKFNAPVVAGTTYSWSSTGATFTGGTTRDSAVVTYSTTGLKTISLTITNTTTGCDSTVTQNVYVDSLPVATISGSTALCQFNSSASALYQTTQGTGYTYNWTAPGGAISSGQGTYSVSATWLTTGNKTLGVTVTRPSGCSTTGTLNISVKPQPVTPTIQH